LKELDHQELENCLCITNPSHREELLSAIRYLFFGPPVPDNVSEVQASARAPASVSAIQYPVPLVPFNSGSSVYEIPNSVNMVVGQSFYESSVYSNSAPRSSVGGPSKSGSSMQNIICLPNTHIERTDCDSATSGTDMTKYAHTDTSDMASESNCSKRS